MSPRQDQQKPVGQFLLQPRFEVIPMKGVEEEAGFLPAGAIVPVTVSPRKGLDATFVLSEHLAARGFRVIPHLSARLVRNREHLRDILDRLAAGGFEEIFLIGGDATEPVGPYQSAGTLMADMMEMDKRPKRIGIAAYPDGHPLIGREELFRALQEKQPNADYMITQICFDKAKIAKWLVSMRERGIHLPVYIGIPGMLKRSKLLEISLKVGVGDSTRFLMHQFGLIARLLQKDMYTPDALVAKTITLLEAPGNGIAGFHIYTFNQCQTTELWRQRVLKL